GGALIKMLQVGPGLPLIVRFSFTPAYVGLVSCSRNSPAYCGSGRRCGRQGARPVVVTHLRCAPPSATPSFASASGPAACGCLPQSARRTSEAGHWLGG